VNAADSCNRKTGLTFGEYEVARGGLETSGTGWRGGNTTITAGFQPASHCAHFMATPGKVTDTLNTTTAWTYSTGVGMTNEISINLTVSTSYASNVALGYSLTDTSAYLYLCGRTGGPDSSDPGYVVASAEEDGGPA